jgi:prepilin-type N-terminal cleavage/methylation domain-containing protein
MKMNKAHKGFSLAEVLMATGILALGMAFIAGVFPAAIHYSIVSTERTMSAVAADEAFAKIRLYGVDVNLPPPPLPDPLGVCADFSIVSAYRPVPSIEFGYPSISNNTSLDDRTYFWFALCRRVTANTGPGQTIVQVTVFVSRKIASSINYYQMDPTDPTRVRIINTGISPAAVRLAVTGQVNQNTLTITDNLNRSKIMVGGTIVEDSTGRLYRVIDRDSANPSIIILDKVWQGPANAFVWVVPAAVGGGRYPCVGVFQREILF